MHEEERAWTCSPEAEVMEVAEREGEPVVLERVFEVWSAVMDRQLEVVMDLQSSKQIANRLRR